MSTNSIASTNLTITKKTNKKMVVKQKKSKQTTVKRTTGVITKQKSGGFVVKTKPSQFLIKIGRPVSEDNLLATAKDKKASLENRLRAISNMEHFYSVASRYKDFKKALIDISKDKTENPKVKEAAHKAVKEIESCWE